jgi:hypothetical protein
MKRAFALTAFALLLAPTAWAADATPLASGQYIEARTTDVWTGPCFANADVNIGGKHAIMAWKIDKGEFNKVNLNGLGVVAVVTASDTLGTKQTGPAKAVLIVDDRASESQRKALVELAKKQGGDLLAHVVAVKSARVDLSVCDCQEGGCGTLKAGDAQIKTRCLDHKHDKVCGNETAFFPPLSRGVKVQAALAEENTYSGKGVDGTWKDRGRRGAYLGTFAIR